jgi:hypothetical protein
MKGSRRLSHSYTGPEITFMEEEKAQSLDSGTH